MDWVTHENSNNYYYYIMKPVIDNKKWQTGNGVAATVYQITFLV